MNSARSRAQALAPTSCSRNPNHPRRPTERAPWQAKKEGLRLARLPPWTGAMEAGSTTWASASCFGLADWRFEICPSCNTFAPGGGALCGPQHQRNRGWSRPSMRHRLDPRRTRYRYRLRKIVAIWRLAVPYTGNHHVHAPRRPTSGAKPSRWACRRFPPAAAPIRAAMPRPSPTRRNRAQFQLGDHRDLDEVVRDVASMGYVPSFCTGLLPAGTHGPHGLHGSGQNPARIKLHCDPNALSTFTNTWRDYAGPETRKVAKPVGSTLANMDARPEGRSPRP